ncbi:mersacidin/lichenicidin family type 2 lantibiotic [Ktedonospora formicarum]|uniref:Mersacidin/lichenicidin family type 2 lantibiotic n=1 Tax=Ktedonospora formicarum TaxID=2778364 RepID=A0A8J3MXA7_9CHLR|nr:mersacidin/lichenicidin family type 2 lantibiotic [Ktedonospora formicarum]GHO48365.1 hypothetical protein KSX_65280 [Ktedonospora formicarum]
MNIDIIRAWKDRSYRESLSAAEQALLPENPVGQFELSDEELKEVSGAQAQTGVRSLEYVACWHNPYIRSASAYYCNVVSVPANYCNTRGPGAGPC